MKAIRFSLALILCFGAFWGAAHFGILVSPNGIAMPDMRSSAAPARSTHNLARYFPIIR